MGDMLLIGLSGQREFATAKRHGWTRRDGHPDSFCGGPSWFNERDELVVDYRGEANVRDPMSGLTDLTKSSGRWYAFAFAGDVSVGSSTEEHEAVRVALRAALIEVSDG